MKHMRHVSLALMLIAICGTAFAGGRTSGSLTIATAPDDSTTPGAWTTGTDAPAGIYGAGSAVVDGKIYIFGGILSGDLDDSTRVDAVRIYDPATDSWSTGTPMPTARSGAAVTALNGKIYVFGGEQDNHTLLDTLEIYDPTTDSWSIGMSMDMPRSYAVCGGTNSNGSRICVAGGRSEDAASTDSSEMYFPGTDTWKVLDGDGILVNPSPMVVATRNAFACEHPPQGELWVFGGRTETGALLDSVQKYAIAGEIWFGGWYSYDSWSMPIACEGMAGGWIDTVNTVPSILDGEGAIFVVGGRGESGYLNSVNAISMFSGEWSSWTPMPTARMGAVSGVVDNKLYVIGGKNTDDGNFLTTVEVFDPDTVTAVDDSGDDPVDPGEDPVVIGPGAWTTGTDAPERFNAAASASIGDKVYLFGGRSDRTLDSTLYDDRNNNGVYDDFIDSLLVDDNSTYTANSEKITFYHDDVRIYDAVTDTWSAGTPMPTARSMAGAVVIDGLIYIIGGNTQWTQHTYNTVEIYNPATDSWTTGVPMPTARDAVACAYYDGKIYVIGGRIDQYQCWMSTVEIFDIASETWSTGPSLPTPLRDAQAFVVGGKIYVPGGYIGHGDATDALHVFDLATGTWSLGPDMPMPCEGYAGGIIDDVIYLAGGRNISANEKQNSRLVTYEPASGQWQSCTAMPTARRQAASGVVDGKLVVLVGANEEIGPSLVDPAIATVEIFDPEGVPSEDPGDDPTEPGDDPVVIGPGAWTTGTDAPDRFCAAVSASIGDKVYICGGISVSALDSTVYDDLNGNGVFDENIDSLYVDTEDYGTFDGKIAFYHHDVRIYDAVTDTWSAGAPMPTARTKAGVVVVDGLIYVIGGDTDWTRHTLNTVEIYNPATDSWTTGVPMPTARDAVACAYYDGKIYVIGGRINQYQCWMSTVEIFDIASETWSTGPSLPTPLRDAQAFVVGGKIYVPGGYIGHGDATDALHVFDPATGTWSLGPDMPMPCEGYTGGIIDDVIYLAGGRNISADEQYNSRLVAFEPVSGQWQSCTALPTARVQAVSGVVDGKLVVVAGGNGELGLSLVDPAIATVEIFDPTGTPTSPPVPTNTLILSDARSAMGTTIAVSILTNIDAVGAADLAFTIDPTMIEPNADFIRLSAFDTQNGSLSEWNMCGDTVRIAFAVTSSEVSVDSVLAVLAFDIKDDIVPDSCDLTWLPFPATNVDEAEVSLQDGEVVVLPEVVYGDVSQDGNVTSTDASIVLKHVVRIIDEINTTAADVSDNGLVTSYDARLILYKVVTPSFAFPVEGAGSRQAVSANSSLSWTRDETGWVLSATNPGNVEAFQAVLELPSGADVSVESPSAALMESNATDGELRVAFVRNMTDDAVMLKVIGDLAEAPVIQSVSMNEGNITVPVAMPVEFAMQQNAPNPFNPTTSITFSITEPGFVQLNIYSVTGQVVRTLVSRQMVAGHHTVVWDANDMVGRQAAAGVYIYRLTTNEGAKVRRMTLVR